MAAKSRNKGAEAERELARLIDEHLGIKLRRRLAQYQAGGHDLEGWEGVHIECKRYKTATQGQVAGWWQQTLDQCPGSETPVLAYRPDSQAWRFVIRPSDWSGHTVEPIEVTIEGFAEWARHQLKGQGVV